jgi:hypothetical protein
MAGSCMNQMSNCTRPRIFRAHQLKLFNSPVTRESFNLKDLM